jgi:predicted dehydrogenase/threonine dehydrogenase-like Zn-dependent dehydrogenase
LKQVTQRLRDGRVEVLDVPPPSLQPHGVLVDVRASLLSAGTEASKVQTGRKNLAAKARARPDHVRQVVEKAQRDGLRETIAAVQTRLDQPEALGYSAAGVVLAVGAHVAGLAPGDRVASGGGGHANHAEIDYVPENLCVRLPEEVAFEEGAFATVGAIAMQGVRQARAQLGERVAVVGLGLVGQLTAQLLNATSCHVIGIDLSDELVQLAIETGAVDQGFARSRLGSVLPAAVSGCDAVILTAATTSDDPVKLAAELCRDRGRVVVVGDVRIQVPRAAYYGKELEVRFSRSYGPGRYDRDYEERGLDYPVGYVRWTERRNMAAFVDLVANRRIDIRPLVRARFPVEEAPKAYEQLLESDASPLGILLQYGASTVEDSPDGKERSGPLAPGGAGQRRTRGSLKTGVVGAGSFASRVLIPALQAAGFSLEAIASANGLSAQAAAQRFSFARADTPTAVLADPEIDVAVIATRHATHASLGVEALRASKAVFIEKPPALTLAELGRLRDARAESGSPLFVGFNRRYAPLVDRMRGHIGRRIGPVEVLIRVAAGPLPREHWLLDPMEGGGRLIGEGCHFVDLACWLAGSWPVRISCSVQPDGSSIATANAFSVLLTYPDGSLATILYGHGGAPGVGKEYVEVHSEGRSSVLHDFHRLTLFAARRKKEVRSRSRDKGHRQQLVHMRESLLQGQHPEGLDDPLQSMAVTFSAVRAAEEGRAIRPLSLASIPREEEPS